MPQHGLQVEETLEASDVEGAEALMRYWWANSIRRSMLNANATNIVAVDMGCGCGYGTTILAEGFEAYPTIGVDCDREALNMARRDYGSLDHVKIVQMLLLGLDQDWMDFVPRNINLATVFETIEMLRHRDFFLDQLTRRLAPDGVALFSAGLHRTAVDSAPKDGVFANFRYNGELLVSTLRRYFKTVIPFGVKDDKGVFAYVHAMNKKIREAAIGAGQPPQGGRDLVYCSKPIKP